MLARFRILSELGRGTFARVYLAEQVDLADRPVALKVSRVACAEPQNLARLQHTDIVPIHSVHTDPESGLHLICMPYVGGANLEEVLRGASGPREAQISGRSLITALDRCSPTLVEAATVTPPSSTGSPVPCDAPLGSRTGQDQAPSRRSWWRAGAPGQSVASAVSPARPIADGPGRRFLVGASRIQAGAWIIAKLAEGLAHAHDRGILHRDIKPSNVLIAADGTPMLLDFNLSMPARPRAGSVDEIGRLGGTLPYMAPEHLEAFAPRGDSPAVIVGPHADLYALGLILYEIITGTLPFPEPSPDADLDATIAQLQEYRRSGPAPLRTRERRVPWSLDAIVRKCLAHKPEDRYQHAADLAEDLHRFLDDRPLRFTPEPSLCERLGKWARRHPRASSASSIGLVALILLALASLAAGQLRDRLAHSSAQLSLQRFRANYRLAQLHLNAVSGPRDDLGFGIARASEALALYRVGQPHWLTGEQLVRLLPEQRRDLLEAIVELILLRERAQVRLAVQRNDPAALADAQRKAVRWLDLAAGVDPEPSYVLYEDRARYKEALGLDASDDRRKAASLPLHMPSDFAMRGTAFLARGQLDEAVRTLNHAVSLDPGLFWGWFALGLAHQKQGRFPQAAADFAVCSIIEPSFAWPHMNRGLSLAEEGDLMEARDAYDQALRLDPRFAEAMVNRALVALRLGEASRALADLNAALALQPATPAILAARGEALAQVGRRTQATREFARAVARQPQDTVVLVARGVFLLDSDPAGARRDFEQVLKLDPRNAAAYLGLAHLTRRENPREALRHLDRAIEHEPELAEALELRALVRARLGDPAAEADADRLVRAPTARRLYNAACAMSLLWQATGVSRYRDRAIDLLRRALDLGFPRSEALGDPDLAPLRALPGFPRETVAPDPSAPAA